MMESRYLFVVSKKPVLSEADYAPFVHEMEVECAKSDVNPARIDSPCSLQPGNRLTKRRIRLSMLFAGFQVRAIDPTGAKSIGVKNLSYICM